MIYKNRIDDVLSGESAMQDIYDTALQMGYDLENPEHLSGFIKNIIGRIKTRIQERKAQRAASGQVAQPWAVSTPAGTLSLSPDSGNVDVTSPINTGGTQPLKAGVQDFSSMMKNPLVIVGAAALIIMVLSAKK